MRASKALTAAAAFDGTEHGVTDWRLGGEPGGPKVPRYRPFGEQRSTSGPKAARQDSCQIHPFSSAVVIASIRFFAPSLLKISDM